jgi:hypothetical protein
MPRVRAVTDSRERMAMLTLLVALPLAGTSAAAAPVAPATRRLVADGHFLRLQGPDTPTDDEPFVYQADTAWNFLLRANTTEAVEYFEQRGQQGFNAIQAVATGMHGGFRTWRVRDAGRPQRRVRVA